MFIPVVFKDGHEELVSKDELQSLMFNKQVMFFKRSDGWVVLGRDKMRDLKVPYNGVERRRPGIQRVIDLSKKRKIDVVVVVKLDRLTRQVADLGFLTRDIFEKHEIALASVVESIDATTAAGMLMLNVLGAVAQDYSQAC